MPHGTKVHMSSHFLALRWQSESVNMNSSAVYCTVVLHFNIARLLLIFAAQRAAKVAQPHTVNKHGLSADDSTKFTSLSWRAILLAPR